MQRAGEYILELRVEYAQGANKIFKEEFHPCRKVESENT